jgi:hypothetical protein
MLVVKIELWPMGDESRARCIGKAEIALTDVTPDRKFGNYKFNLLKWGVIASGGMKHLKKDIWKQGRVEGHDRVKRGPWDLLLMVLLQACKGRVPGA